MQDSLDKDELQRSESIASSENPDEQSFCGPVDEPLIVARYSIVDSNGKKREMIRTRSGREIPMLTEDEAAEFFEKYTYHDKEQ